MADSTITGQPQTGTWTYYTPSSASDVITITSPGVGGITGGTSSGGSTGVTAPPYMQNIDYPSLPEPDVVNGQIVVPQESGADEAAYSLQSILTDPSMTPADISAITQALLTGDRSNLNPKDAAALAKLDKEVSDNQTFEQQLLAYVEKQMPGASDATIISTYMQVLGAYYSGDQGYDDVSIPSLGGATISQVLGAVQTIVDDLPPTTPKQVAGVSFPQLNNLTLLNNTKDLLIEDKQMLQDAMSKADPSTLELLKVIMQAVSNATEFLEQLINLDTKQAGLFSKADYQSQKSKLDVQQAAIKKEMADAKKRAKLAKKMKIVQDVMIAVSALMIVATCGTMAGAVIALTAFALITVDQQCNKGGVMNKMFSEVTKGADGIAGGIAKLMGGSKAEQEKLKKKLEGPMQFILLAAIVMAATYFGGGAGLAIAMGPVMDNGGMAQQITSFWHKIDPNPVFDAVMTAITVLVLALACGKLATAEKTAADEAEGAEADSAQADEDATAGASAAAKSDVKYGINPLANLKTFLDQKLQETDEFFTDLVKVLKKVETDIAKGNTSTDATTAADGGEAVTAIQKSLMKSQMIQRIMSFALFLQGLCQVSSGLISLKMDLYQKDAQKVAGEAQQLADLADAAHKILSAIVQSLLGAVSGSSGASGLAGSSGLTADLQAVQGVFQSTLKSMNVSWAHV